jgi:hypothetical protein
MTPEPFLPDDRVRESTAPEIQRRIDDETLGAIERYARADIAEIDARIAELDREWDIERVLAMNASTLMAVGLALGLAGKRRYFLLPVTVLGFFIQHQLQGWCPPIPIFRRLGYRTAREIAREKFALKALRGDFDEIPRHDEPDPERRVRGALAAVDA